MISPGAFIVLGMICLAGCATAPGGTPDPGPSAPAASRILVLDGTDDAVATESLASWLAENGFLVEYDRIVLTVYRDGRQTRMSPVLEAGGLDRIIISRRYPVAPGTDAARLTALMLELNAALNVGVFAVDDGQLLFEGNLTFVDRLAFAEVDAYLRWLDTVEAAIRRVEGETPALLWP